MTSSSPSPFEALDASFQLLCQGPRPLRLHGRVAGPPLPARPIPLTELRGLLLHPAMPSTCRERALCEIVRLAVTEGGAWTVGLAGVLLPRLRLEISAMCRARPEEAADLEAGVLAGLVEVLATCDADDRRVGHRLVWAATRRAKRRHVRELAVAVGRIGESLAGEPRRPWGHPDFVLGRAVKARVLTPDEADLIGETRLSGVPLRRYAAAHDIKNTTAWMRRQAAERELVAWLPNSEELLNKRPLTRPSMGCGSLPVRATDRSDDSIPTRTTGGR